MVTGLEILSTSTCLTAQSSSGCLFTLHVALLSNMCLCTSPHYPEQFLFCFVVTSLRGTLGYFVLSVLPYGFYENILNVIWTDRLGGGRGRTKLKEQKRTNEILVVAQCVKCQCCRTKRLFQFKSNVADYMCCLGSGRLIVYPNNCIHKRDRLYTMLTRYHIITRGETMGVDGTMCSFYFVQSDPAM